MEQDQRTDFFSALMPFSLLPPEAFHRVLGAVDILYFPAETTILSLTDQTPGLYIILKGLVVEEGEEGPVAYHGPEEAFDLQSLLFGKARHAFAATEETLAYLLPGAVFHDLAATYPTFGHYFSQNLVRKRSVIQEQEGNASLTTLMTARVAECPLSQPLVMSATVSIRQAVRRMRAAKSDAILARDPERGYGIVTGSDFLDRIVVERLPQSTPVGEIAQWNPVSVSRDELLAKALLLMTKRGVRRLVVTSGKRAVGLLGITELLSFLNNRTFLSIHRVEQATTLEELAVAAAYQTPLVRSLAGKGVRMRFLGRLIQELDRRILQKAALLLAPEGLLEQCCLVVMGSEGREEQILKTDQDNALIVAEGADQGQVAAFGRAFTEALGTLGYRTCPGNVMMSNPQWSGSLDAYLRLIDTWIQRRQPDDLMQLATLFDARPVAGNEALLGQVRAHLLAQLPDDPAFYSHFARPILTFETPLGLFSRFLLDRGKHRDALDIKKGGIFPIVHGVRSLALEYRLERTNTIRRIKDLVKRGGGMSQTCGEELIEAFDFLTGLRLRGLLEKQARGEEADNYIRPEELNSLEREILRDAFMVVNRFKKLVIHHYRLSQLT